MCLYMVEAMVCVIVVSRLWITPGAILIFIFKGGHREMVILLIKVPCGSGRFSCQLCTVLNHLVVSKSLFLTARSWRGRAMVGTAQVVRLPSLVPGILPCVVAKKFHKSRAQGHQCH